MLNMARWASATMIHLVAAAEPGLIVATDAGELGDGRLDLGPVLRVAAAARDQNDGRNSRCVTRTVDRQPAAHGDQPWLA
jgi:hypothetical protein